MSYSNSITLARVADGKSANSYYIETNCDEILRFKNTVSLSFSPSIITFQVFDLSKNDQDQKMYNFDWNLSFLYNDNYIVFASKSSNQYGDYIRYSPFIENEEEWVQAIQDGDYNTLYLDFQSLFSFLQGKKEEDLTNQEENFIKVLEDLNSFLILKFSYTESTLNYVRAEKLLVIKNGVSADMAKLDINAADIVASMQEASLRFSENGLELKNGDFKIYKEITEDGEVRQEPVLYTEDNNLVVKGRIEAESGFFNGIIHATDGEFEGEIRAKGGNIGGFNIISEEKESYLQSINGAIKLDGTNGNIIAKNIELGAGATISEHIAFPYIVKNEKGEVVLKEEDAYIYNPSLKDRLWLSADRTKLYTDGRLQLGTIELYGGSGNMDAYIKSLAINTINQKMNGEWSIHEDGTAYFKNLIADEVRLQNSVLEIGTIQNVGSLMLFKDAWTVESISTSDNKTTITLSEPHSLINGDYIYTDGKTYQVENINKENNKAFTINSPKYDGGKVITKFGNPQNDYILSIYGESKSNNDSPYGFATSNSLTIASFDPNNSNYTKHLILGDLSNSELSSLQGQKFGLYADNVFLTGSLTTQMEIDSDDYYAGVNTKSPVPFTEGNETIEDVSPIIFWSGARGQENENIQTAPFQVTTNGTLYASQAIIQNSVVAGADIFGSRIYTAEIHGWENQESNELAIYNSSKGIVFKTEAYINEEGEEVSETTLFSITGDSFQQNGANFIKLDGNTPLFVGDFQTISDNSNNYIKISGNNLSFGNDGKTLLEIICQIDSTDNNNYSFIDFNIKDDDSTKDSSIFQLHATKIEAKRDIYISNNMEMGSHTMTYKKVNDGYDLYVY